MCWKCRLGFHDWYNFRLVEKADIRFGFSIYDRVCLRCGKFRLDGTEGRARWDKLEAEEKARNAAREARAVELLKGRVEL